jgi:hypothetical protein
MIITFLWLTSPLWSLDSINNAQFLGAVFAGFATSPAIGYIVAQLNRSYYFVRKNRPQDRDPAIPAFYASFHSLLADKTDCHNVLVSLQDLSAKDLQRFVTVAYANEQIRERSESYWERYHTNVGIVIAICIGAGAAAISSANHLYDIVTSGGLKAAPIIWTVLKLAVLVFIGGIMLRTRAGYAKIAIGIENAWIRALGPRLADNPQKFADSLFK